MSHSSVFFGWIPASKAAVGLGEATGQTQANPIQTSLDPTGSLFPPILDPAARAAAEGSWSPALRNLEASPWRRCRPPATQKELRAPQLTWDSELTRRWHSV